MGKRHVRKLILDRFTIKTFLPPSFFVFVAFSTFYILHGSDGAAACASPGLRQRLLVQVGALVAAGEVGLHLPCVRDEFWEQRRDIT